MGAPAQRPTRVPDHQGPRGNLEGRLRPGPVFGNGPGGTKVPWDRGWSCRGRRRSLLAGCRLGVFWRQSPQGAAGHLPRRVSQQRDSRASDTWVQPATRLGMVTQGHRAGVMLAARESPVEVPAATVSGTPTPPSRGPLPEGPSTECSPRPCKAAGCGGAHPHLRAARGRGSRVRAPASNQASFPGAAPCVCELPVVPWERRNADPLLPTPALSLRQQQGIGMCELEGAWPARGTQL